MSAILKEDEEAARGEFVFTCCLGTSPRRRFQTPEERTEDIVHHRDAMLKHPAATTTWRGGGGGEREELTGFSCSRPQPGMAPPTTQLSASFMRRGAELHILLVFSGDVNAAKVSKA